MKNSCDVLNLVKNLTTAERKYLVEQILSMMSGESQEKNDNYSCNALVHEHIFDRPACPHCGAQAKLGYISKRGFDKGVQRYYCKTCGRRFVATTKTAFERSRKDADTWRKYIKLTIEGVSLSQCASICRIAYQTAFNWRHKILNVFRSAQEEINMTGWVEADEMLIPLSFKGNHIKGRVGDSRIKTADTCSDLHRKAYKRGSDNKPKSNKERACVFCMVENADSSFYAAVPGVGFMDNKMLNATLARRVNKENALVLIDNYKVTRLYLKDQGYKSVVLASNTSDIPGTHKPEIQGENRDIHLQHVNAMHRASP